MYIYIYIYTHTPEPSNPAFGELITGAEGYRFSEHPKTPDIRACLGCRVDVGFRVLGLWERFLRG